MLVFQQTISCGLVNNYLKFEIEIVIYSPSTFVPALYFLFFSHERDFYGSYYLWIFVDNWDFLILTSFLRFARNKVFI